MLILENAYTSLNVDTGVLKYFSSHKKNKPHQALAEIFIKPYHDPDLEGNEPKDIQRLKEYSIPKLMTYNALRKKNLFFDALKNKKLSSVFLKKLAVTPANEVTCFLFVNKQGKNLLDKGL